MTQLIWTNPQPGIYFCRNGEAKAQIEMQPDGSCIGAIWENAFDTNPSHMAFSTLEQAKETLQGRLARAPK